MRTFVKSSLRGEKETHRRPGNDAITLAIEQVDDDGNGDSRARRDGGNGGNLEESEQRQE